MDTTVDEMTIAQEPNKRRLPRMPIIPPLPVKVPGKDSLTAELLDASIQGIRLAADQPFTVEAVTFPQIVVPDPRPGLEQFISLEALCVWCREQDSTKVYHAGFKIQKIGDIDFTILKGVIETARRRNFLAI